jgi:hypothetical protein
VTGRSAAVAVGLWALLNAVLATLLLGFRHNAVQVVSYWCAVATVLAIAAMALRAADPPVRRVPEASAGTILLAVAIALLVLGAGIGLWAALLGGGLAVVAIVVLLRERAG